MVVGNQVIWLITFNLNFFLLNHESPMQNSVVMRGPPAQVERTSGRDGQNHQQTFSQGNSESKPQSEVSLAVVSQRTDGFVDIVLNTLLRIISCFYAFCSIQMSLELFRK